MNTAFWSGFPDLCASYRRTEMKTLLEKFLKENPDIQLGEHGIPDGICPDDLSTQVKDWVLVEVPDLEIFTQGYDFADAIYMARDAMGLKGISLEDRKLHVPKPSDPSKSLNLENSEFSKLGGTILSYVDIDFEEYRKSLGKKMKSTRKDKKNQENPEK